jgi:hypothetical protein
MVDSPVFDADINGAMTNPTFEPLSPAVSTNGHAEGFSAHFRQGPDDVNEIIDLMGDVRVIFGSHASLLNERQLAR